MVGVRHVPAAVVDSGHGDRLHGDNRSRVQSAAGNHEQNHSKTDPTLLGQPAHHGHKEAAGDEAADQQRDETEEREYRQDVRDVELADFGIEGETRLPVGGVRKLIALESMVPGRTKREEAQAGEDREGEKYPVGLLRRAVKLEPDAAIAAVVKPKSQRSAQQPGHDERQPDDDADGQPDVDVPDRRVETKEDQADDASFE